MLPDVLVELVHEAGGEALLLDRKHARAIVSDLTQLVNICRNLRHHGFTRFMDYTGEHTGDDNFTFRLVLRNAVHGHALLQLKWKFRPTPAQPAHATLSTVWPAAGTAEREMFEMLGVPFAGNENLKPMLLDEQHSGNPLRKDYVMPQAPEYAAGLLKARHEAGMLDALSQAVVHTAGASGSPSGEGPDTGDNGEAAR